MAQKSDAAATRERGNAAKQAKAGKSKGGRPRRDAEGGSLEKLTIRLTPKLKFGLETLARLQGRSLSQSIEWALQHALTKVGSGDGSPTNRESPLWGLLSHAWEIYEGWRRTYFLYSLNPMLVSFEERHACALVERSREQKYLYQLVRSDSEKDIDKYNALMQHWEPIVAWAWTKLLRDANTMDYSVFESPDGEDGELLCGWLGIMSPEDYELPIDTLITKLGKEIPEFVKSGVTSAIQAEELVERQAKIGRSSSA